MTPLFKFYKNKNLKITIIFMIKTIISQVNLEAVVYY